MTYRGSLSRITQDRLNYPLDKNEHLSPAVYLPGLYNKLSVYRYSVPIGTATTPTVRYYRTMLWIRIRCGSGRLDPDLSRHPG
jgi:hypothetical protein